MSKSKRSKIHPLGVPVPEGAWNLIISREGKSKEMLGPEAVESAIKAGFASEKDGVLCWNPRYKKDQKGKWQKWDGNPSSTVWRHIPPLSLAEGATVKFSMFSRMDRTLPKVDYTDAWTTEENAENLRNVAGTGDFRIGLMQTNGDKRPGKWQGFQVRIYPYLHRDAKSHTGGNDTSNCSYWYREKPGGDECLIDDYSQMDDRDGFKKLKHKQCLKFGMGPHAPFDEWFDVEVKLRRVDGKLHPVIRVHEEEVVLDAYEHKSKGFDTDFDKIDAVCISFNNMRPYCGLQIKM